MEKISSPAMMLWQLERLVGQLILVGDHYADPKCPCSYGYKDASGTYVSENCIPKHLLAIYEYATETAGMTKDEKLVEELVTIADETRQIRDIEKEKLCGKAVDQHDIYNWARDHRKVLEKYLYELPCQVNKKKKVPAPAPHYHVPAPAPRWKIYDDIRDAHRGELFGTVWAEDPKSGRKVGGIDFGTYDKVFSIHWIEVAEDYRRQGIGRAMIDWIRQNYADHRIAWGTIVSDEGSKFVKAVSMVPAPAPTKVNVCRAIQDAKDSHVYFLGVPEDPKTGSHAFHENWIRDYDAVLKYCKCPMPAPAPAATREETPDFVLYPERYDWCNLDPAAKKELYGWKPARDLIGYGATYGKVKICQIGMVEGAFQITITFERHVKSIVNRCDKLAKAIPTARRVYTPNKYEMIWEVMLPETEAELTWKSQEVKKAPRAPQGFQESLFSLLPAPAPVKPVHYCRHCRSK